MAGIGIWRSPIFPPVMGGAVQLGTLIENDWNPANWSGDTGACTFDVDGITLNFSGGAGFNQGIYYNKYFTNLENFRMEGIFTINSLTNYGPSLSQILPLSGLNLDKSALIGTGGVNNGRLDFWDSINYIGSDSIGAYILGDQAYVKIEKLFDVITFTMTNIRLGSTAILTKTFDFNFSPLLAYRTSVVWAFGFSAYGICDAKVNWYKYTGLDYKNSDACLITDSKGLYFAGTFANTITQQLRAANPTKTFNFSGGVNETLTDVRNKLPELLLLNSKKYFLEVSSNDKRNGRSQAQMEADMLFIKNTLEVNGNQVYAMRTFPEKYTGGAGIDVLDCLNAIDNVFAPAQIVDTFTPLSSGTGRNPNPAYIVGDDIHIPEAAHTVVATELQTKL